MSAFRHRDFRVFWAGALLSNIGSALAALTVPYLLYQSTGSAALVGAVTVAMYLPVMLASPIGGGLADRVPRRELTIICQSLLMLVAATLWLLWLGSRTPPWVFLAVVTVIAILNGLCMPAWQALVNDMVPRSELLSAVTLNSAQFNLARALGPALAGILLATLGAGWTLGLNVLSYGCVIVALSFVRAGRSRGGAATERGLVRQFAQAVRYVRTQPGIRMALLLTVVGGFLVNPLFTFTVVFAGSVYNVGPAALGFLNLAAGLGAIIMVVVMGRARGWRFQWMVHVGLFACGLAVIAFGAVPNYAFGLVALTAIGGLYLIVNATTQTSVQSIVADGIRSRVLALRLMALGLGVGLGGLVQGAVAEVVGPQVTTIGAGVIVILIATVLLRSKRGLRSLDDPHDEAVIA